MSLNDHLTNKQQQSPAADWVTVPAWIDQGITVSDAIAIVEGGCESGAYMPAVTYHKALATLLAHEGEILDSIEDMSDAPPVEAAAEGCESIQTLAVRLVSAAVERWAVDAVDQVADALDDDDDDDSEE